MALVAEVDVVRFHREGRNRPKAHDRLPGIVVDLEAKPGIGDGGGIAARPAGTIANFAQSRKKSPEMFPDAAGSVLARRGCGRRAVTRAARRHARAADRGS
jgi:hypothetical protein